MISVIIPLYNKEKYIRETLKSLEAFSDIEIIVIDNASTDGGVSICIEESKKNSSIRVLSQSEQGVSATRNVGISEAKGEYICFLDADDQYANLESVHPGSYGTPDIIVFGFKKIDNKRAQVISEHRMCFPEGDLINERIGEWMFSAVNNFIAYNVANKIYRTEFLRENNLVFEKTMDRLEDFSFFVRAVAKAKKIVYNNEAMHLYRTNMEEGSLVHKVRNNFSYLQRAAEIYRNMESDYAGNCSKEQVTSLEKGLYKVITRELSIMRLNVSISDNRMYNRRLQSFLKMTKAEIKGSSMCPEYIKYRLVTIFLIPFWFFTRARWQ